MSNADSPQCPSSEGGLTIEVTPAMKEAGVAELLEGFRLGGDYGELVAQIFIAMAFEEPRLSRLMTQANSDLVAQR